MSSGYSSATGGNVTSGQTQVNNVGTIGAVLALVAGALMLVYIVFSLINWSFLAWSIIPAAVLSILGGALYMAGKRSQLPWLVLAAIVVSLLPINGGQIMVYSIPGLGIFRILADFGAWGFFNGVSLLVYSVGYLLLFVAFVLGLIAFIQRARTPVQVPQFSSNVEQQVTTQPMFANDGTPLAGWFPDPQGNPAERYWDGASWTEQTRPRVPGVPGAYAGSGVVKLARNGMGTAALTLGIIGVFLGWLFSLLAIIFGSIGIGRANRGEATNKSAATLGLWLGIVGIVLWILVVLVVVGFSI